MELEVMGREVIKPASPAPKEQLQLSLFDFSVPKVYVSAIFFFHKVLTGEPCETISGRLKASLSKTLSRFYPLAGRIEGVSINCNDEGAVLTEARTNLLLSDFLQNTPSSLTELFPPDKSAGTWPLLSVKVSFFGSGSGVAIAVAISHKIADAASVLTFVQGWATIAKGEPAEITTPQFAGVTIFPPPPSSSSSELSPILESLFVPSGKEFVTNRFVFKSSKISELKRKAATESVPVPSRVEAITSLICRCPRNASRANSSARKPTLIAHALDLRRRIPSDVISPFAIGNLQSLFSLKKEAESEMEIGEIVAGLRKAKDGVNEIIKEGLEGCNDSTTLGMNLLSVTGATFADFKSDVESYAMSSWCKMPFYEVDFGWGTPVWVGVGIPSQADVACVVLIDSKDGEDVEAWVVLPKQDMTVFTGDQDFLTYALLNPPILL